MSNSASRIWAVASLTFREAFRRRVVLAAALMALAFLALYGLGLHFASTSLLGSQAVGLGDVMRRAAAAQMLYLGLSAASFLVALTAVFTSAGTLSGELDSGVIYGVLARPIRRDELVLGKFLGLAAMIAAFTVVLNGVLIALAAWLISAPLTTWPIALVLLALAPIPLVALAVLGSSRLPTLANGVMCAAAFGIGLVGGVIEEVGALLGSQTMANLGIVSSLLMPLDAIQRMALTRLLPPGLLLPGQGPPGMGGGAPSVWMAVYAIGYVVVMVALAGWLFSRRDL